MKSVLIFLAVAAAIALGVYLYRRLTASKATGKAKTPGTPQSERISRRKRER